VHASHTSDSHTQPASHDAAAALQAIPPNPALAAHEACEMPEDLFYEPCVAKAKGVDRADLDSNSVMPSPVL